MSVLFLWKIYFHPLGDRTAAQVNWVTSDGLLKYFRPLSPGFLRSSLLNIDCFLKIQRITFKLTLALQIQKQYTPKVSFFWDPSQDKISSGFPSKIQAFDWLTHLVYQIEACYLSGKKLELICWPGSQRKTDFSYLSTYIARQANFGKEISRIFFFSFELGNK